MALKASLGQYYSADSPLHRADPRAKIACALIFMLSCPFIATPPQLILAFAAAGAAVRLAHIPLARFAAQMRPLAVFFVVTSLVNLFFVHDGAPVAALGPLVIHEGGVSAAVLYTLRFVLMLAVGSLLLFSTAPTALTDGIERLLAPLDRLGASSSEIALTISIALRFVPILAQEARDVVDAQIARGATLGANRLATYARLCVPMLAPLFSSALRHAEALGIALEARCYTGGAGRTHYRPLKISMKKDGPLIAGTVVYLLGIAALALFA